MNGGRSVLALSYLSHQPRPRAAALVALPQVPHRQPEGDLRAGDSTNLELTNSKRKQFNVFGISQLLFTNLNSKYCLLMHHVVCRCLLCVDVQQIVALCQDDAC